MVLFLTPFQKEVIAERERREDLLEQIKRISDATSRLLVNVRVEDNASSARLREKAVDAMTAVVVFFNSILVYSSHNYFGNSAFANDKFNR